ncbi:MAG: hypothetical protein Q8L29_02590 [archaeon]|nr:hypothetical protein [archaeon]
MKGTVFKYGGQGDPLVMPESGGKIVVLTGCKERPKIGTEVNYVVDRQGKKVVYATLQKSSQETSAERPIVENPLEKGLNEIQGLWDKHFAEHMTDESRLKFPKSLKDIRDKCLKGDYKGAAQIANANYEWALHNSDSCEGSGPGFAYFSMFQAFKSLAEIVRKTA